MPESPYTPDYYRAGQESARRSARAIVPLILELVRPGSVIDVGCGLGTWLSVFRERGISEAWGIDGPHIDEGLLEIPMERFRIFDLEQPFFLEGEFDLVVSLEVAEHLHARSAALFIRSITCLAPVVLFSAAIPFQGGVHHVNEQWPAYWAGLFQAYGYVPIDCLRRRIWPSEDVDWWYAQNSIMYVARDRIGDYPLLEKEWEHLGGSPLALVHPRRYLLSR